MKQSTQSEERHFVHSLKTVSRVIFTSLKHIYGRLSPVVLTAVDNTVTLCCDWQLRK